MQKFFGQKLFSANEFQFTHFERLTLGAYGLYAWSYTLKGIHNADRVAKEFMEWSASTVPSKISMCVFLFRFNLILNI